MSVMCCESCSVYIDTDFDAECFREDMEDACLCESCYEARLADKEEEESNE